MVDGDQGVNLGGGHRRMAKQLLNDPDVRASVQQMGGKGMSHRMRRYVSLMPALSAVVASTVHALCLLNRPPRALSNRAGEPGPRATSTGRARTR